MQGAYYTDRYTNLFLTYGYSEEEINNKLEQIVNTFFYCPEEERIYHRCGEDMGYVVDTGNDDVRTEGMSYAMMMCVQLDMKEEFNRLWKWVKTYMWMKEGENSGYFAWSVSPEGIKNSYGPAPDGEEYFAMALFFAANRWGNGEGIFDYTSEARAILGECIHKGEIGTGYPMWNPKNYLIKFIPNCGFTDPSYHLPHFYRLFSEFADERDREFWIKASEASGAYLKKACHPVTGLAPEYANYDGSPNGHGGHDKFFSDSYRVAANIGLDYEWFAADEWECELADRIQTFFGRTVRGNENHIYEIDGTDTGEAILHPTGLLATNAMASLASKGDFKEAFVRRFWNEPLRTGRRRYYDNCLYIFAFLALSGRYRIWK